MPQIHRSAPSVRPLPEADLADTTLGWTLIRHADKNQRAADLNAAANKLALKTYEFAHEGQTMPPLKVPYKP
ncbi:hypothetical protein ABH945_007180 [Paraburkholderia sp. GAS333]